MTLLTVISMITKMTIPDDTYPRYMIYDDICFMFYNMFMIWYDMMYDIWYMMIQVTWWWYILLNMFNLYADVDAMIYDSKHKHQELHTSERTIVPWKVTFVKEKLTKTTLKQSTSSPTIVFTQTLEHISDQTPFLIFLHRTTIPPIPTVVQKYMYSCIFVFFVCISNYIFVFFVCIFSIFRL